MIKKLNLGFCSLIYSSDDKSVDIEQEFLIKAYKINKNFAKIEIPQFDVKLVYSRKEFDKIWGSKTQNYVSAFTKDNNIVIFSYEVFDIETNWKKEKFQEALIHEINHLFYQELRNNEYDPLWLSEGLATFMQHKKKKFNYKKKLKIKRAILNQSCGDVTLKSYQIFTLFVEYLILEFGEDKILELIVGLKDDKDLNILLNRIYNKSFNELIENGNKYHKIA
ncbi:MAG: hypothetical protein ABH817_00215 [archaeon]